MTLERLDPRRDSRWQEFILRHPHASVFHSASWLEALHRTYAFEPRALAVLDAGGRIQSALVYCRVRSWLTGNRLVSLPFSDHCEVLAASEADAKLIEEEFARESAAHNDLYAELRPLAVIPAGSSFVASKRFHWHRLSLQPSENELFHKLHKDSIQRKIRRAEREGLAYQRGRDDRMLADFFRLQVRTRRRHNLPPPPVEWFHNLAASMGDSFVIRLAVFQQQPVAATVTLSFRDRVLYKYGASDERYHHLGGVPFLFWKMIRESKTEGAVELDFGRSDWDNTGLVRFKEQWNTDARPLTYWRFPAHAVRTGSAEQGIRWASGLFRLMPDSLLIQSGRFLYRHIG